MRRGPAKFCALCEKWLPEESFPLRPNGRGGKKRRTHCKPCESRTARESRRAKRELETPVEREARLRAKREWGDAAKARRLAESPDREFARDVRGSCAKMGIDPVPVLARYWVTGGLCEICGRPASGRYRRLAIDHCHETGTFRGLLCTNCNAAIGQFGDDPARLLAAIEYLNRHAAALGREILRVETP